MTEPTVFLSYSHKDEVEKDELLDHLGVLGYAGLLEVWSDDEISGGDDWQQRIREAMAQARIAILLISANFLNSDFILNYEVPTLLKRQQEEGLIVLPLIAKACAWRHIEWLAKINVRPKNGRPIWRDEGRHAADELSQIADEVAELVEKTTDRAKAAVSNGDPSPDSNGAKGLPKVEFVPGTEPPADKKPLFEQILRRMFPGCRRLLVKKEFAEGSFSGSWVYRVEPYRGPAPDLEVVVKIAAGSLIEKEQRAYEQNIRDKWPNVALIKAPPVFVADKSLGGLYYELVGQGVFDFVSLRQYCLQASLTDIETLLGEHLTKLLVERVLKLSSPAFGVRLQASYDHVLPMNILVRPTELLSEAQPIRVAPDQLPSTTLQPGDPVRLEQFVVTKVDAKDRTVTLNLSRPRDSLPDNAYTLRLKYDDETPLPAYTIDQPLPEPVEGEVLRTRASQWADELQKLMGHQSFDLASPTVALPDGTSLPNPLLAVPEILNKYRHLKLFHIHGDLNTENILAREKGHEVRLIDFAEARVDHVLHDFLRLETEVVTKLLPQAMLEANLSAPIIRSFYEQLHRVTFAPSPAATPQGLPPALEKAFAILKLLRQVVREYGLYDRGDVTEYYEGLTLYLLGALKFVNLDKVPSAPLPKQLAFWGAAAIRGVVAEPPSESESDDQVQKADNQPKPEKQRRETMPRDETPSYGVSISDVKGDIKGIIADRDVNLGQGNIITGDISGSYTAIGHGASVTVNQSPGSNTEALMFEAIYRQIEQRPDDPDVDKDEIVALVQSIQQEAASGAQANEKKLIRWLTTLKALAPDIFATTTTGLARADLGFAPNISQIAIQIK